MSGGGGGGGGKKRDLEETRAEVVEVDEGPVAA